ncbi:MAG: M48 family metalloprotease [Pseudomonadota bacterium]
MALTALERYAKLEAEAQFFDGANGAPLPVIVSFGARSLMIADFDERSIAHWPLASLVAQSSLSRLPVSLAPDRASTERIELKDPDMIAAIGEVCQELWQSAPSAPGAQSAPPQRRRRWLWVVLAVVLGTAIAATQLDLRALVRDLVPPADAADLGVRQTALLAAAWGGAQPAQRCAGADGVQALDLLVARIAPAETGRSAGLTVLVLDHLRADALSLPGGRVILTSGLLAAGSSPEDIAGVLAVEATHISQGHPLDEVIAALPVTDWIALTSGAGLDADGQQSVLQAYLNPSADPDRPAPNAAEAFANLDQAGLPTAPLRAMMLRLKAAGAPYAARRAGIVAVSSEAEGAAGTETAPFQAALGDRDWLALGDICETRVPISN